MNSDSDRLLDAIGDGLLLSGLGLQSLAVVVAQVSQGRAGGG